MTIQEAINKADEVRPNGYAMETKVGWLSSIDGRIFNDIISTHKDNAIGCWHPYTEYMLDHTLIAPHPFDEMYVTYLGMRIDEANGEAARYNNSAMLFNSMYEEFAKDYTRKHMPITKSMLKIF